MNLLFGRPKRQPNPPEPPKHAFGFFIDVFSHCNLRCPSCLVGNKFGNTSEWPKGLMSAKTLDQILEKATRECTVQWVSLFNWTEPLLHPNIVELIGTVKKYGAPISLSSNLNVLRDPEALVAANPNFLRISLSGFTQAVYERGHRDGDIEIVKKNMVALAKARTSTSSATHVEVFFHKYAYNLHELDAMKSFSEELGFQFTAFLAQIYPVEKIIAIAKGSVTDADREVLDALALPLDQALSFTAAKGFSGCTLLDDQVAIDVNGNVAICCAASMDRSNSVGNFLTTPLAEIQRLRNSHALCGSCMELGIPDYLKSQPEFEGIAAASVAHRAAAATR